MDCLNINCPMIMTKRNGSESMKNGSESHIGDEARKRIGNEKKLFASSQVIVFYQLI